MSASPTELFFRYILTTMIVIFLLGISKFEILRNYKNLLILSIDGFAFD